MLCIVIRLISFLIAGRQTHKLKSGLRKGSLVSPVLYTLYIDDIIAALVAEFTSDHAYACADEVCVVCLRHSEVRKALIEN